MLVQLKPVMQLPGYGMVAYGLFRDQRVPVFSKVLAVVAILAIFSPLPLPDWIPVAKGLGQIALVIVVLRAFINAAPDDAREEHMQAVGLTEI